MALRKEISGRITDLLQQNPQGLSITEIVRGSGINRNTAGRYLDNLLVSGQVEMRHFGMAKIYSLSMRLPASSVLSLSSEYVMQLDSSFRVTFLNHPFATLIGMPEREIVGKNIEFSRIPLFFDEVFPQVLAWLRQGLEGTEFRGELEVPAQGLVFSCRITPTVSNNGQKGVSVIFEDITEKRLGEQRLRESEQRLQLALSGSETGMWEVEIPSMKGTIDDRAAEIIGYRKQEIGSMTFNWDAISHPEDIPLIQKRLISCLDGRTPLFESEHRMRHASGEWVWVSGRGKITHRNPDGTPLRITGTIQNITERKLAERALQESEEKFRALFNNANDMIMLHELKDGKMHGRYVEVNDAACRTLRYTRQELLTLAPKDIVAHESLPFLSRSTRKLQEEAHATFETVLQTKDHQGIPVEISAHRFDFKGKPVALAIIRDITERKQAEEMLSLMKISIDNAYDEVFWMDLEARFLYVNDAACQVTGYSREELCAMKVYALDPDFTPERWEETMADLRKKRRQSFQTRHKRKDGVILDVEINTVYVTREEEEYVFCFVRDITRDKQVDAALRESETRYRSLSEASQDFIFVIDREDRVVYVNQQAAAFIKKPVAEVVGKPRSTIFPPEISARQYEALAQVFTTGQPVRSESPMSAGDGLHWFDHALMPVPDAAGQVTTVLGVSRDITKRVVAEQERLQNEQNNRFIAEHSVDIIHRLTPECVCTYTSPSVTALLGYTEQDVLGKPVLGMIHPEDLSGVQKDILEILTGKQDTVTSTFRFRHKDGHYLWFESTTRIVRDAAGNVKEFISISRDITGRKR
jgi:PAS domain S-box-containing protein